MDSTKSDTHPSVEMIVQHIGPGLCNNPFCDERKYTVDEAIAAINDLRQQDMEYVIGVDDTAAGMGLGGVTYRAGTDPTPKPVRHRNDLRAEMRQRMADRLNGTGEKE